MAACGVGLLLKPLASIMANRFGCPKCGCMLGIAGGEERKGELVRCSSCGSFVSIPGADGASFFVDFGEEKSTEDIRRIVRQTVSRRNALVGGVALLVIIVTCYFCIGTFDMGGPPRAVQPWSGDAFSQFEWAFSELNRRVVAKGGMQLFDDAEYRGDGIVVITATDAWLTHGFEGERRSSLNTVFELWETIEGSGHPVAVYVEDPNGVVVMKQSN